MESPYATESIHQPVSTKSLFANYNMPQPTKGNERGELLKYFSQKLGRPIPMIASLLKNRMGTPSLVDLFYLKSLCNQEEGRTYTDDKGNVQVVTWGQAFFGAIKKKDTSIIYF